MSDAPRRIVLDTSVAVKFYIPEEWMEEARRIRAAVDNGLLQMLAPTTIQPEFWNTLWQKRRRNELSPEEAREIWAEFSEDPLSLYAIEDLMPRAAEIAETGAIIYDALFIALAEAMETTVITADRRLVDSLRNTPHQTRALHLSNAASVLDF